MNDYINKEVISFETILGDSKLTVCEKLDAVLDAYFNYAKKMVPLRSVTSFHTERHYVLTEKLIAQLKKQTGKLLSQGVSENVFDVGDADITAGFILYGLTSIFDVNADISDSSFEEMKNIVNKLLRGNQK